MKKLLLVLLVSLGLIGNSYADVKICSDVIIDKDHMESIRKSGCISPMKEPNWECKEGYVKYGNGCYEEGEIPQEEIRIILDENGQKEGEIATIGGLLLRMTLFYKNGQKRSETVNIFGDHRWDKIVSWYENGQKKYEGNYNNENKIDGKWTYWNENGQITSESNWKDGECISGDCPK